MEFEVEPFEVSPQRDHVHLGHVHLTSDFEWQQQSGYDREFLKK